MFPVIRPSGLAGGVADDEPAAAQWALEEKYGVPEASVPGVGNAAEVDVLQVRVLRPCRRVTLDDFAGHANVCGDVGADAGVGGGEGDDVAPSVCDSCGEVGGGVRCLVFLGQWWKEYCFER